MSERKHRSKKMLIETERLIITEFTPDMAQTVQENSSDEDNRRFVPDEVWETKEEAEETLNFLISQYESFDGPLAYPVIVKKTKDNIGYVQLCPIDNGKWEIGYHIAKKYTGNGFAAEAVKAFLPVIAREINISEIYGICLAENEASLAVMRKCGFENVFTGIGLYQGTEREIVKNVWKSAESLYEYANGGGKQNGNLIITGEYLETGRTSFGNGVSTDAEELIVSLEIPEAAITLDKSEKTEFIVDCVKVWQK